MALAQELEGVGSEVGDEQAAAGASRRRRVGDRRGRVVEQVQHVMHDRDVEASGLEGRPVEVALADRGAREACLAEVGAGELEHVVAHVEADAALAVGRHQLEDAARPGADVEQPLDRALAADQLEHERSTSSSAT